MVAPVELAPGMRRGVVSLPHGWGHDRGGTRQGVAADQPGVNVNQLNDGSQLDPLSGTAVLNGIPVDIAPARTKVSSQITVTEKLTLCWPGSSGTASISARPRHRHRRRWAVSCPPTR